MHIKILCFMGICFVLAYSLIPTYWYKLKTILNRRRVNEKKLYLTFDDGPDKRFICQFLDLLNKYNVKATFFVVAKFAKANSKVIDRMKKEGHLIGLHSLEHKNGLWQTPQYIQDDFKQSDYTLKELGVKIKYFRPPWGHLNIQTLVCVKQYGFKIVMWNVMAQDWKGNTTWQEISQKLIRRTKNGDILCLHDGRGTNEAPARTIAALEVVLPLWISQGYKFARMDEKYE